MKRGLLLISFLFLLPFVSASYDGGFSLDKSFVQLGDQFTITGNNIQFEGAKYNGNAMIILNSGNESYTLLTVINEGEFSYIASFCDLQECVLDKTEGEFKITVELLSLQLESLHQFQDVLNLNVVNKLDIALNLKETQLFPGDPIDLEGSVFRSTDSIPVTNMEVNIFVDEIDANLVLNTENFEYETALSNKIASNYHDLIVTAEDAYGNVGNNSISFYITPVPQWMEIKTNNGTEFMPAEDVIFTIDVFDQAGTKMPKDVEFKIINPNGKKVLKDNLIGGQEFIYSLEEYELPGEWIIEGESEDLEAELFFYVPEIKELDVSIEDYNLIIKNIGNVYYDDNFVMTSQDGGDKRTVSRRTNLAPGEEMILEMYTIFNTGRQTLYISNTGDEIEVLIEDPRSLFSKVGGFFSELTGQAIMSSGSRTSNVPTIVMIALFVVGLIVFSYRMKHERTSSTKKRKFKFPNFKRKKSKDDVDDLKDRILRDIENSKEKKEEVKKESSPVMPSIFDKDFSKVKEPKSKPSRVEFDKPFGSKE